LSTNFEVNFITSFFNFYQFYINY